MSKGTSKIVLCFGEVLWDALPQGLFLGGAPINVAYHLKLHGFSPVPVTAVGEDALGDEILNRLHNWGLPTSGVVRVKGKPTGVARVELSPDGSPHFVIEPDAAWDWIELAPDVLKPAEEAAAIVYGTLSQRGEYNRSCLADLLSLASGAMKVLDVNLRPPYDSLDLAWSVAQKADMIKLNRDELNRMIPAKGRGQDPAIAAAELGSRAGCRLVCVTSGAEGAGLWSHGEWHRAPGRPVRVRDTVGAGDAFLAALVAAILEGKPNQEALEKACRLGEFVAASEGATPPYKLLLDGSIMPPAM